MADFLKGKDEHEALLNELLDGNIDQTRKTEILQELRTEHTAIREGVQSLEESNEKYEKNNNDLITSNSQLFRQLGYLDNENQKPPEEESKEFSETVTVDDLTNQ